MPTGILRTDSIVTVGWRPRSKGAGVSDGGDEGVRIMIGRRVARRIKENPI